jgi:hypothetical protein
LNSIYLNSFTFPIYSNLLGSQSQFSFIQVLFNCFIISFSSSVILAIKTISSAYGSDQIFTFLITYLLHSAPFLTKSFIALVSVHFWCLPSFYHNIILFLSFFSYLFFPFKYFESFNCLIFLHPLTYRESRRHTAIEQCNMI